MIAQTLRIFPDQGSKLRYLIKVRGDQRERSRANPTLAKDAADGGHPRDARSSIVVTQADLADFLGVSPQEVSRWCHDRTRYPDRLLGELCRLYAIRERDFRVAAYETFVGIYGDPTSVGKQSFAPLSSLWRRLLGAASRNVEVLATEPDERQPGHDRTSRLRYATAHRLEPAAPLPEIIQDAPFWLRLVSPQRTDASLAWPGWHLVLLNHDIGRDGFRALLPRATNDPAHWPTRMPAYGLLTLPRAAILRHEAPDLGVFAVIAIMTRDLLPPGLLDRLAEESAHGLALEPILDELTEHLAPSMQDGRAALAMARYRVVPRQDGGGSDG